MMEMITLEMLLLASVTFLAPAVASTTTNCTVTTEQGVVEGSWFSQYPSCEYKASTTLVFFILI